MLPTFQNCLICESIRPELDGKLIVLGFFGICPNVDIRLQHLDQPTVLTFLVSGGSGEGSFWASLEIVDPGNQQPVAVSPAMRVSASPNSSTHMATAFMPTFGHAGEFFVRCLVDSTEIFRGSFRISQGALTP